MGYRYRLGKLDKKIKNKYDTLVYDEVLVQCNEDNDPDFIISSIPEHKELLIIDIPSGFIDHYTTDFFLKFNLYEHSGCDFLLTDKNGLKALIEHYRTGIISSIENDITNINTYGKDFSINLLDRKREKWDFKIQNRLIPPYKLLREGEALENLIDGQISADGSMEYQIFNLVFIYNTFDWDNDLLILNGW